jgi:hypothetical protein
VPVAGSDPPAPVNGAAATSVREMLSQGV